MSQVSMRNGTTTVPVGKKSRNFPNRRIVIELTKPNGEKFVINQKGDLCAVSVRIKRNYGGIDPQAQIAVCNIPQEIMAKFMTQYYAPENPDTIAVYAGYEGMEERMGMMVTQLPLIFYGTILWAIPTTGRPDIWFQMTCNENFWQITHPVMASTFQGNEDDIESVPMTPIEIVNQINDSLGREEIGGQKFLPLQSFTVDTSKLDLFREKFPEEAEPYYKKYDNYAFVGTLGAFLNQELGRFNQMSANIQNGQLKLCPNSAHLSKLITKVEPQYTISAAENNMIGVPYPNPTGVNLTTLFNPRMSPLDTFRLDSHYYTSFNMKYWIQTIEYHLETRGQAFYNHIIARRAEA
ncbi:hypothetical protein IKF15_00385 [Candidatus Saccharibacteria bacterium]|nr:hypothetical protein [Candidatus Saccharibacteria bacterium]